MRLMRIPIGLMKSFLHLYRRFSGMKLDPIANIENPNAEASTLIKSPGTFTQQHGYKWVVTELSFLPGLDVVVWRSVSTSFLRSLIHRRLYGEFILDLIYRLEEFAPHFIGRVGQYPMILSQKNDSHHERKGEK
jgi:hypothetical protein